MNSFGETPPLGLYLHLPWCIRKCPYCDFNSHVAGEEIAESEYVSALLADLRQDAILVSGRVISSIFVGGGTPSLFSAAAVARLLDGVAKLVPLSEDCEITLEANPGAAERKRFSGYREAGVNRLSVGVQSFNDDMLKALGRIHDGAAARIAVEAAYSSGFSNLNIDLMHSLPGQTPAQAEADVVAACEFEPTHLSHYQLTIEPNTRRRNGRGWSE